MLECIGIGSLPHTNPYKAMEIVKEYFTEIPFWPQLINFNKNEDMLLQFLEGMPSFFSSLKEEQSEQFILDYNEITKNHNNELLQKYGISDTFSSTFKLFLEILQDYKYAKGQIIGPYTLSQTIKSEYINNEIIVKVLALKALWQIEEIKRHGAIPIILIDEPLLPYKKSQMATQMIADIAKIIRNNGGISGVHCCGECNWDNALEANVDIINPDIYTYSENFIKYVKSIKLFLNNGGKIAWGIVPTKYQIQNENINSLIQKFDKAVNDLTKLGINEKLIISNSYITQSCGAGALSEELSIQAMKLTKELSDSLKERYNDN